MLPLYLPNGVIAVYGTGTKDSSVGITLISEKSEVRFGTVSKVYDGGAVFVYDGDNVMFREEDVIDRVKYLNYPYTLLPARLVTREVPLL